MRGGHGRGREGEGGRAASPAGTATLALDPDVRNPEQVPAGIDCNNSDVRRTVAAGRQILAQLGLDTMGSPQPADMDPEGLHRLLDQIASRTSADWIDDVPAVRSAQARVEQSLAVLGSSAFDPSRPHEHPSVLQARKALEQAEHELGYTEIRAPVAGYVNRRGVNPGDNVLAGQALLAILPLEQVYIVANFKETQLGDLTIGMPVTIHVDAYPGRSVRGRVSGFAPATGSASSMLPPENATGNFVKVVQRLPVRIDLVEPNPEETPLMVGMSVVPEVDLKGKADGPDAGRRLRTAGMAASHALAHARNVEVRP